jgi:hypothetical protein
MATDGTNTVSFVGAEIEDVFTSSGNNLIVGNALANVLTCGDGNQTVEGGLGDDIILDFDGDEVYQGFNGNFGNDIIDDQDGTDLLDISNYNMADVITWEAVDCSDADPNVDNLVLTFSGGQSITLWGYFYSIDPVIITEGYGLIETIKLGDDSSVDFAQVLTLI